MQNVASAVPSELSPIAYKPHWKNQLPVLRVPQPMSDEMPPDGEHNLIDLDGDRLAQLAAMELQVSRHTPEEVAACGILEFDYSPPNKTKSWWTWFLL